MNFEYFFAKKIAFKNPRAVSALVVRLAIITIALAVAVMEISLSLAQGFQDSIKQKVIGFVSHVQVGQYGFLDHLTAEVSPIKDTLGMRALIQKQPDVKSVSPYILKWAMIESKGNIEVWMLKGIDANYDWDFFKKALKEGKMPDYGSKRALSEAEMSLDESLDILISRKQAQKLELKVGEKATLLFIQNPVKRRPVKVVGIYDTGLEEFDAITLFCDIRLLQNVMKWQPSEVMGYEVDLVSGENITETAAKINALLGADTQAVGVMDMEAYRPIFDWLNLQSQTVWGILILMIIVAIINMTSVVLILIIERTRTIGILSALGLSRSRIQGLFVWNIFFLIGIGLLIGNVLGLGLLAIQYHFQVMKLDAESYFLDYVPVAWVWGKFIALNIATILICTLFMYLPTLIIAKISPVKAIRFD